MTKHEAPRVSRAWIVSTLVALLVLGGLGGAGVYWWRLPMQGGYNLAVAGFTYFEPDGRIAANDESQELSRWFYQVIEEETHRLPSVLRPETRGPDRIRPIRSIEADRREAAAAQLAERLKATILIYGQVQRQEDGGYLVQPEFFVSSEGFLYGSEATGPNKLGSPIRVEAPLSVNALELNVKLNARVQALQDLVSGLGSYYLGNNAEAATKFQQAIDIPQWNDEEGKEVAYFLLGQAYLRSYDILVSSAETIDRAYDAFKTAYQLNPEYARACLGLGAVALQRSGIQNALQTGIADVDQANLEEAHYWYRICTDKSDQSLLAYIPVKADYGLGQVNLLGASKQIPGYSALLAREEFERVIAAYQSEPNHDLSWYAAHAHAYLGWLAYWTEGDSKTLDRESRQAINLLEKLPPSKAARAYTARYWSWIGFAQVNLNDIQKAKDAYNQAVKVGIGAVNPAEIGVWNQILDNLN